jgi:hypothetical protein
MFDRAGSPIDAPISASSTAALMKLRLRSGAISVQPLRFDSDGNVSASQTLPSISKRSCLKLAGCSYVEVLEGPSKY